MPCLYDRIRIAAEAEFNISSLPEKCCGNDASNVINAWGPHVVRMYPRRATEIIAEKFSIDDLDRLRILVEQEANKGETNGKSIEVDSRSTHGITDTNPGERTKSEKGIRGKKNKASGE